MAVSSLYRRYRPRTFSQVRGQDHVVGAMRNAVRSGTEGHAYLFSGPRGTGKTSTARILAKALNCEDLQDGEPCCACDACLAIEAGSSMDLFELDAASNNKVDDMRSLIGGTVVASPGRTKVYILDEVHMLSTGASNALLKTLEEPPTGVCFVLATTDPNKVLPTIRSRTQHFEFRLLSAAELDAYVRWIAQDAGLELTDEAVAHVVRVGRGSARDTLSALDQVVAAGGVAERSEPVEALVDALAAEDAGAAVQAVAAALGEGHDPRVLAESVLAVLRNAFLCSVGVEIPQAVDADRSLAERWAADLGTRRLTRALERLGAALVDMRHAADPRVPLEVALVSLTSADDRIAELEARVEALESGSGGSTPRERPTRPPRAAGAPGSSAGGGAPTSSAAAGPTSSAAAGPSSSAATRPATQGSVTPSPPGPPPPRPSAPGPPPRRPGAARPVAPSDARSSDLTTSDPPTSDLPSSDPSSSDPPPAMADAAPVAPGAPTAPPSAPPSPAPSSPSAPSAAGLDADWARETLAGTVLPSLKGRARALVAQAQVERVDGSTVLLGVANEATMARTEEFLPVVTESLTAAAGRPVEVALVVAGGDVGQSTARSGSPQVPGDPLPDGSPSGGTPVTGPDIPAADAPSGPSSPSAPVVGDDPDEELEVLDVDDLEDASDVATTGVARLTQAFPGAVVVDDETPS